MRKLTEFEYEVLVDEDYFSTQRNPYAGVFNKRYLTELTIQIVLFKSGEALYCLRENVWATEGKLEIIRQWESYEYRRNLMLRMLEKGVIFSTNADDYFGIGNSRPRLTPKFLNKIQTYTSSTSRDFK